MGAMNCCCCKSCFPKSTIPVISISGATEQTEEWTADPGDIGCCYRKNFTTDGTPEVSYRNVYKTVLNGVSEYEVWGTDPSGVPPTCSYALPFFAVITGSTDYYVDLAYRLKISVTGVNFPGKSYSVSAVLSKVCDKVCEGEPPKDYYVLEVTRRVSVVIDEERSSFFAISYNASTTSPCQPLACSIDPADLGKWTSTLGVTSVKPTPVESWDFQRNVYTGTITIVRYEVFETIPEDELTFEMAESEEIEDCKQTPCMRDSPMDGALYEYDYPEIELTRTWSIVELTPNICPFSAFVTQYKNRLQDGSGNDLNSSLGLAQNLDANVCVGNSAIALMSCQYVRFTSLALDWDFVINGTGSLLVVPPIVVSIQAI